MTLSDTPPSASSESTPTDSAPGLAVDAGTGAATMAATDFALDSETQSLRSAFDDYLGRLRSGNLGALPSMLAIGTLFILFALSTDVFVSKTNLQNFLEQAAPVAVVAMAVSFVLLLGEIDLAAGFTAGVCAAVMTLRLRSGWPLPGAIAIAILVAVALGMFTGLLVARLGIPSFIVTLSNFLTFQGILLILVKDGGTVRLENPAVKGLVGSNLPVWLSWVFAVVTLGAIAWVTWRKQRNSRGAVAPAVTVIKVVAAAIVILGLTAILCIDRTPDRGTRQIVGVPVAVPAVGVILVVLTFVLNRTQFGRHLYAVGGNAEAARRAGVRVQRVRLSAFTICAVLSAIGGAFLASRVDSVSPNTGGNETLLLAVGAAVIGGTSLFGGKGRMLNAVLGAMVLAMIPNGLPLIGKKVLFGSQVDFGSSGIKFILSGLFLLAAASVDAVSRKRAA